MTVLLVIYSVIADNCNTDNCVANNSGIRFVGCSSHHFNQAIEKFVEFENETIEKFQSLMKKLKESSLASHLRNSTTLLSKTKCLTRWSATFEMLEIYPKIEEFSDNEEFKQKEDQLAKYSRQKKSSQTL